MTLQILPVLPVYTGEEAKLVCVCVVIRAEFMFQVYEIITRTCYVNSGKSAELHTTRGLKHKGKTYIYGSRFNKYILSANKAAVVDIFKLHKAFLNVKRHPSFYQAHHKVRLH